MKQPRPDVYHVSESQTLATCLRGWLKDLSWSDLRGIIRQRFIQIDGNVCTDPQRRLKPGCVVKLLSQSASPAPGLEDVKIVYLDRHVVVVDKPSGLTSVRHATEKNWPKRRKQHQATLEEHVNQLLVRKEGRPVKGAKKPSPVRPVHRIDRDTSGLLVFARTREAEESLAQQFRKHSTHRRYWAIVHGVVSACRLESRLVRDRGDGIRGSTSNPKLGKAAITHVRPVASLGDYTLVECQLETGRTHQIRIHLSESGFPLCGDKTYRRGRDGRQINDTSGAKRLALHAMELGFTHPITGEQHLYKSSLPNELALLAAKLGNTTEDGIRECERQNRSRSESRTLVESEEIAGNARRVPSRKDATLPRVGKGRRYETIRRAGSEAEPYDASKNSGRRRTAKGSRSSEQGRSSTPRKRRRRR